MMKNHQYLVCLRRLVLFIYLYVLGKPTNRNVSKLITSFQYNVTHAYGDALPYRNSCYIILLSHYRVLWFI